MHDLAIRILEVGIGQLLELNRNGKVVDRNVEGAALRIERAARPVCSAGGIEIENRAALAGRCENAFVPQFAKPVTAFGESLLIDIPQIGFGQLLWRKRVRL